ncbi:methionyl-tRNA formyltransferase [Candidatus Kaiserbacteria bacterium]|nr:methionyl-tRNA formyltransferase [Candidatus Kaiserbacteria bacterium]
MKNNPFVFFGTPYVARDTLGILDAHGFRPVLIVTSPDAPRGRGLVLTPSEVRAWADAHNVPVLMPEKIDTDTIEAIRAYGCEYAVVVAYGKILPQALIDTFPLGVLNIHYSLLPKYRGASPVEAALLAGDAETGVSIQRMVYELDAGDVFAQESTKVGPRETTIDLRARLIEIGGNLLAKMLPDFVAGAITPTPQDHAQATRCRKIKKEDGFLVLGTDDEMNWRKYRAYAAWPRTSFEAERNGDRFRVIITSAHFANGRFIPDTVKPAGKNEMKYEDFLRSGGKPVS